MKLYEISDELVKLYMDWHELEEKLCDPEGLEVEEAEKLEQAQEDVGRKITSWSGDLDIKVEAIGKLVLNLKQERSELEGKAKPFREEMERYEKRARQLENEEKKLKGYVLRELQRAGIPIVKGQDLVVRTWTNSQPTITVLDQEKIPVDYLIPQEPRLDRRAIASDWKEGQEVLGVSIEKGEHIRIK
jgi:hypothetical protein